MRNEPASIRSARSLLRTRSLAGPLCGIVRFGRMLLSSLYTDGLLYADELPEDRTGPLLRKPPVERCECHVIAENAEADKLVMHGYDEFRAAMPTASMRLGHGAAAVCAYFNRVFASIAGMTFSEEAQCL
jgi:hypothetical protein